MITFAKRSHLSDPNNNKPEISFLNQDASLNQENYKLVDNVLVSEQDHCKYGKMEIYPDGEIRYYLKQYRGGRAGELLVNPWGMLARPDDLSAYTNQRGHRFCEYIRVREDLFNGYRQYLRTRDPRYFQACNKALLDGDNL